MTTKSIHDYAVDPIITTIFPSSFQLSIKIRDIISDERKTTKDVAEQVKTDPVITAKIISLSNTAYYNRGQSTNSNLQYAIDLIGYEQVKRIILGITMIQLSRAKLQVVHASFSRALWLNSAYTASIAKNLTENHSVQRSSDIVSYALFRNLGAFYLLFRLSNINTIEFTKDELMSVMYRHNKSKTEEIMNELSFSEESIANTVYRPSPKFEIQDHTALLPREIIYIASQFAAIEHPWTELDVITNPEIMSEFSYLRDKSEATFKHEQFD